MIYFVELEGGMVKVGYTGQELRHRVSGLKSRYQVVGAVGIAFGMFIEEQEVHFDLRAHRASFSDRELFFLNDKVRQYIREHGYPATKYNANLISYCEHCKRKPMKVTLARLTKFEEVS